MLREYEKAKATINFGGKNEREEEGNEGNDLQSVLSSRREV